jgi:hypothetical protein
MSNPWVTRECSSLLFYKSPGVFALSTTCVNRDSSSLLFYKSLGLFALSNPCVTRYSSSLLISESIEAVWAVESMRQPREQFVDDF